ncbi:MAG TPA: ATP-binding protein [Vicinamibacterales bacterium]|nr:ATP-binding protein [Vicinamibacterales bacterium]
MASTAAPRYLPWYSSFYWRIALSFVVFVVVVLIGQSVMVSYMARSGGGLAPGNPNGLATAIAADLGPALAREPNLDLTAYLRRNYPAVRQPLFLLMTDGRLAASSAQPLRDDIRRQVQAALAGATAQAAHGDSPTGPVVTAPVQVGRELRGMVVLPPPPPRGILADVGELLSLPGTLVLITATAIAAIVIFAPARNRLRALEQAAERLCAGHLDARAPERGRDEIARVARAFNRMAEDLAARTDALQVSDRLRRQMLADISHELRTPLTSMRGYLDTLDMPDLRLDEDKRRRYLDTVRCETRRLERIVTDLLDLARYENRVASLDARIFAIERVFTSVVRRHEREAALSGIDIRTHVAESADQLTADPDRMEQAISNLVANAVRHTPTGGTIDLEATASGDAYRLSVIDSGAGIAPGHIAHVFERFYKIDASRAAGTGGSGLGLSIVKAIVERHGGTIAVTSRPGRTEFVITLPQSASANL